MVRDSVLWHCHSPGGHGKSEWGNSLQQHNKQYFFSSIFLYFVLISACICTAFLSICRENTHNIGRTQKTTFTSCKQTHLSMTRIRRPVRLPVRWASTRAHTHTRNHSSIGYFYRSTLMWKTRQRADPCLRAEPDSMQWVYSDAGIVPFCTHTGTAW